MVRRRQFKGYALPITLSTIDFLAIETYEVESTSGFYSNAGEEKSKEMLQDIVGPCTSQEECRGRITDTKKRAKESGLKIYNMYEEYDPISKSWRAKCF